MKKHNLIAGFATNSDPKLVEVFCKTARRFHSVEATRIVLATHSIDANVIDIAGRYDVEVLATGNAWPRKVSMVRKALVRICLRMLNAEGNAGSLRVRDGFLSVWMHPHHARWRFYLDYLLTHSSVSRVLLTDVTDVYFQGDVFSNWPPGELHFFEHGDRYGDDNIDSDWLTKAYGHKVAESFAGKPAICAGTVVGSRVRMIEFCSLMWRSFCDKHISSVEQAVLNFLFHTGALVECAVHPNGELVLTLSPEGLADTLELRSTGFAVPGMDVPSVVHMYPRHKRINDYVLGQDQN